MSAPATTARIAGLAGPVLAGLGWMALNDAPSLYLLVNAGALVLALAIAMWLPAPRTGRTRLSAALAVLAVIAVALLAGPEIDGVRRWIALGPLRLHAGCLALPLLTVLLARLPGLPASAILTAALLLCALQPDLATVLGLTAAAAALAVIRRDRAAVGTVVLALAMLFLVIRQPDPLAPVRFVEGVQADALAAQPIVGIALCLAGLLPALWLLAERRYALPLVAFTICASLAAFAGPYPSILLGYGAAPILGLGLALAALRVP